MLNSENSVVCMMEVQSADIIRTANAFKSKSVFKLLGIVNNGFGPSNSEKSDNKIKSCLKTFPMDVLVILLQLILLSLKVSFFIISKHTITVHYFQVTKLRNSKLT